MDLLEHWIQKMFHKKLFCGQMKLVNILYYDIILKIPNAHYNDKGTENPAVKNLLNISITHIYI